MDEWSMLNSAMEYVRTQTDFEPKIAIVLGSGLSQCVKECKVIMEIPLQAIPYFPSSTVEGHKGKYLLGNLEGVPVIIMQGRVHFYEGYSPSEVVRPIRLMRMLGADTIILTNSSGAVNENFHPGELAYLTDQIASFVPNPLRGENVKELGVRFPDMGTIYHPSLQKKFVNAANELGIALKKGVYLQTAGPSFESPAEINMYRLLGADMVGMSTAIEAIAAVHMGMKVAGISCISNMACGMTKSRLTMDEVIENGRKAEKKLSSLLKVAVKDMGKDTEDEN